MTNFEVKTHVATTTVSMGELKAAVTVRPKTLLVPTMKGIQSHRGYKPQVAFLGGLDTCDHRLHIKASAARKCGVAVAKRVLREHR